MIDQNSFSIIDSLEEFFSASQLTCNVTQNFMIVKFGKSSIKVFHVRVARLR